jgi:hypothetical protein
MPLGQDGSMTTSPDFKRALTRVIEPTGGPGVELVTLEDAARFVGMLKPRRQAWPHWDFAAELLLKAAQTQKPRTLKRRLRRWNVRYGAMDGFECPTAPIPSARWRPSSTWSA